MQIHRLSSEQALASLRSSAEGLSAQEASDRLAEFGPNRIEEVQGEPLWRRFVREFTHFFAIILWIAALLALIAELYEPNKGMATLGLAIVGVIVVNAVFSFWQEYRAEHAIAALRRLLPHQVQAMRGGLTQVVAAESLVPGDVIALAVGDSVPADCRVLEARAARVNAATITGESHPMACSAQESSEEHAWRANNVLLAGTALVAGEVRAVVFATGMRTEVGCIAHLTQSVVVGLSPLQQQVARLSRWVAVLATGLGVSFFAIGNLVGLSFWENLLFAIGIIVANVPEGLLPTVTLSLSMATQRMARRNALVRTLPAVETLGATTVICTDKTGTLTRNVMSVQEVFLYADTAAANNVTLGVLAEQQLIEIARNCHTLKRIANNGASRWVGDPMEEALLAFAQARSPGEPLRRVDEVAFDGDRRRLSTVHEVHGHSLLYCKGALESLLAICDRVCRGSHVEAIAPGQRQAFLAAQEAMAAKGLRVLAFAYRELDSDHSAPPPEQELILSGLIGLEDAPRPEVPAAIARCRDAGIRVIMVTGDHPHTACAIGRQIGLLRAADPRVLTGDMLRQLSDIQLQVALDTHELIFARMSADQKLRVVEALKRKGEIVAVTGDGVNDAPALRNAHIGIAMGISGTDVAKQAADMILLDDNFASIVAAVEEGRAVFENIRKFLTYILTSNIPELVPYLAFVILRIPLPLTIIQILAVDLGTDIVPALALGAEKPDPQCMQRPPRRRDEGLINRALLLRAYLFLGAIEAAVALSAFFFVLHAEGWVYGTMLAQDDPLYMRATTACLAGIVAMQVVNVYLCRHSGQSLFVTGLGGNPLLLIAIGLELLLLAAIVYTPWGQRIFGAAALAPEVWLLFIPCAAAMLVLEELRKLVVRRMGAH